LFYAVGSPEGQGVYLGTLDSMETRRLFDADGAAVFSPPNVVVFARQGALWAQPLDMATLSPSGDALPIAGQVLVNIDYFGDVAVSASSTGTVAYRADAGKRQLVWLDRAGHRMGAVGDPDAAQLGAVRLSPDGRSVLIHRMQSGNTDTWLIETERAVLRRFTVDASKEYGAIWSPDGSRIAISSDRKGALDLYERPNAGSGPETLLLESSVQKIVHDWSPDGRYILYQTQSPNLDLWALPLAGDKKPLPLATTAFAESGARFSPDGRWVAYVSNEAGQDEVYVQPFPGPGSKSQISTGGGWFPVWRRDGRELFYVGPPNRLIAAPIRFSGSAVQAGTPAALFDLPPLSQSSFEYDVSPDGRRFLVNGLVEDPSPITIILNWVGRNEFRSQP
jgi:WD40 repeat protein